MRVAAFVILCCALQYIASEIIDEKLHNIFNDKNKYETKNETTSDEFEIEPTTGNMVEKKKTYKEFLSKNGCGSDGDEGDVEIIKLLITKDDQGRERIYEEDTIIKTVLGTSVHGNVGIPVTSTSSSSASAASQTPQSNNSVATGSAASAAGGTGSTSSAASAAGTQGLESGNTSAAASSGSRSGAGRPESIYRKQGSFEGSEERGRYDNALERGSVNGPGSGSSGTPGDPANIKGEKTGTQQPKSGLLSEPTDTAPGQVPTGLDFYGSGLNGEYYSVISSAAASAASGRAGPASSAASVAGTKGPESGSTSAAASSGSRSAAVRPGGIYRKQGSFEGSEGRGPHENALERGSVIGPGSDSSGSPGDTANIKGDKTGTQQPKSGPLSKPTDTAPGQVPTGLDFYGSGLNGEYYSVISSAAASTASGRAGPASSAASVAGTKGPESGSTSAAASSGSRSAAVRPGGIYRKQGSFEGSEGRGPRENALERGSVIGPGSDSSGSPGDSANIKGDKTGTQQPKSGPLSKPTDTAPGQVPTGLDFYGSGLNGVYYSVISSAAASAASGRAGPASSAASVAGTKGPESGSTSAAGSSGSRSGAGYPESIYSKQGSFEGSEERGPYEIALERGSVNGPGSGSSGSPGDSANIKGDKTGTQQPKSGLLLEPTDTAPGQVPTGLDFYGSGLNGEYYSVISSAAASAASGTAGPASSAASVAGTKGPESGSTSPAASSGSRAAPGRPGSIYHYGSGLNGEYYSVISSAAASAASGRAGPASSAASVAGTKGPESGSTSAAASSGSSSAARRPYRYGSGLNEEYYSAISSAAASVASGRAGPASSAASVAGTKGPESGSTSAAASSGSRSAAVRPGGIYRKQGSFEGSEGRGPHENALERGSVIGPVSGSSGSPGDPANIKGDKTGTQQPKSGPLSKPTDTAPGQVPTGLDFYGSGLNGEYYSVISSAAASAASGRAGPASSAASVAGTKGTESGSTSAAASSGSRSGAGYPESIYSKQGSFEESEERGPYEIALERGSVNGPGSGSSGSPGDSANIKGDKTGTQQPKSGLLSEPTDTAPGQVPTGLDFYGSGLNGEYYSVISSAAASAASGRAGPASSAASIAGTKGPESGSTSAAASSGSRSAAVRPGGIYCKQGSFEGSEGRGPHENALERGSVIGPGSDSSGSPGDSANIKGDKTGTQQPKSGPLSKPTDTAPGQVPTGLDFYGSGLNGEYYSVISSAAASAASGRAGPASSAASVAGTKGTESGSTSAAASSGSRSGAGYPESIYSKQGSLEESEERGPYEIALERGSVNGPGSGSSGSPGDSANIKGDKTGTQQPKSGLLLEPTDTATGQVPTGLDFYGSGLNGEYYSVISSAAASAASGTAGPASSAASVAGTKGPESGSTSPAASSGSRAAPGRPGSIYRYGSGLNGEYYSVISSAAASAASGRAGPASSAASVAGTKGPESGSTSAAASSGSRSAARRPYRYGSGLNKEYYSAISSAAASVASGRAGPASSAASVARTKGPESGSTSAAASSGSHSGAGYPGSVYDKQGSFEGSVERGPYEIALERGSVNGPGSGSSGSPGDSANIKGDKTGTQQPKGGLLSEPTDTAPGQVPTGLDFYGSGLNGEYYSVISSAAASAASGTAGPASSAASVAGTKGPESGSTSAAASSGSRSTAGRPYRYGSGLNGEYYSVISSAAASAASGRAGPASSAASVAGTKGPESGSTSPAASSGSHSGAGYPGSVYDKQGSFEGSVERGPYEIALERGSVNGPGSGSSGSPGDSANIKGDKTGTQQPKGGPLSKPTDTAPGQVPTGLDFYGSGSNGENYSVISSAAASAASGRAGPASSAASVPGTKGPESGSTSAAATSGSRSAAGRPGIIYRYGSGLNGEYYSVISSAAASAASGRAGPASSAASVAGTKGPESGSTSAAASSGSRSTAGRPYRYGSGLNGEYYSVISSAAASAASGTAGPASSAASVAGTKGPESGSTLAAASSGSHSGAGYPGSVYDKQGSFEGSVERGPYEIALERGSVNGPGSGSSGSPGDSANIKGDKTGTQQPKGGLLSEPTDTAPGQVPTGLDFYGSGLNGEYYSVISSAAASAASGTAGPASSAASVAGTKGPESGSTSPAASSGSHSGAGYPGSVYDKQGSFEGSVERGPYEIALERGSVNGPGSGSSGSPGDSANIKGDKTGTQQPKGGPLSKPTDTAPGQVPTGLDFYGSGSNGENYSVISSAAASAASGRAGPASSAASVAGTKGPESGSTSAAATSGSRSAAGRPGIIYRYGSGLNGEYYSVISSAATSAASGRAEPASSAASVAGTKGPESGSTSAAASSGSRSTAGHPYRYGSGLNGEYYSVISSAAASAASGTAGPASSAASVAGTKGPESGSTLAAASSGSHSGAGYPGSVYDKQGSFEGSVERGPYEIALERGSVNGPGSGSSGSPGDSANIKGDKTGIQQPKGGLLSEPTDTAPGQVPTGLDFYGSGLNGEYYSVISSAAASAASGRAGPASSAASVARKKGPESGSTSAAASSGSRSAAGRPGIIYRYGSGLNGEYYSVISSAAASAASGRAGPASSAASVAGTKGPESGSTSAAASSGPRSAKQGLFEGSEERGPYENALERGGFYRPYGNQPSKLVHLYNSQEPGSGSSGSPGDSANIKGDKTGTQQPKSGPLSKPTDTAPGLVPTELDFYGSGLNGEYYSVISSAAASAASGTAGPASSAENAAGTQGPESGSTLATASSDSRSGSGRPGSIYDKQGSFEGSEAASISGPRSGAGGLESISSTQGSEEGGPYEIECGEGIPYRPFDIQRPKVVQIHNTNRPVSGLSGTVGASPTTKEGVFVTQRPGNEGASRPIDRITGNNQNELRPDYYGPGYYGQDYLAPQEFLIIVDNAGGSATDTNGPESESSGTSGSSPTTKEDVSATQQPGVGPASKPVDSDTITGNSQTESGLDSYGPGYYEQDYLLPQELLTIDDNVGGSASDTDIPESGSSGTPGASPTTIEGVYGTQRQGSGPASKSVDNITGNDQIELVPDLYGPIYYGQDYSAPEELPTINHNKRGSESSASLVARASNGEAVAGIRNVAPTTSGVESGVTSVQGRKRVRQACRLRSSQFVLRLGRKGQPCTFCY